MRSGGNAIDAAITAAAVQAVVEPFSTGVGGDCFLMIWVEAERKLYGLNGSGRSPTEATLEAYRGRGLAEVPFQGPLSITVPGAVDAWCEALERFGTKSLQEVLAPAIAYAREGYPVSEIIAHEWELIVRAGLLQNEEAVRVFTAGGEAPRVGSVMRLPDLAATLEKLGEGGREVFYRGELARRIAAFVREAGGLLREEDLAAHRSEWVEPIGTSYRGYWLWELPPNGQGLTALLALNILENFDLPARPLGSAEALHLEIEAVKLAFADRNRHLADPEWMHVPVSLLLSKDYAQGRAALIDPRRAIARPEAGSLAGGGDTVCLVTADDQGNAVSLINSLFAPFGSGMVVPGTGIALQNRGRGFVLDPEHPNCLAPRKRPFHTIVPAMLFRDGRPLVAFGVMGGDLQAQGHVQLVAHLVDYGLNIQEAIDFPRFHYLDGNRVALEAEHAEQVRAALVRMGHIVEEEAAALFRGGFGGGQGIAIDSGSRVYWGGSDWRKDGCAAGF